MSPSGARRDLLLFALGVALTARAVTVPCSLPLHRSRLRGAWTGTGAPRRVLAVRPQRGSRPLRGRTARSQSLVSTPCSWPDQRYSPASINKIYSASDRSAACYHRSSEGTVRSPLLFGRVPSSSDRRGWFRVFIRSPAVSATNTASGLALTREILFAHRPFILVRIAATGRDVRSGRPGARDRTALAPRLYTAMNDSILTLAAGNHEPPARGTSGSGAPRPTCGAARGSSI